MRGFGHHLLSALIANAILVALLWAFSLIRIVQ